MNVPTRIAIVFLGLVVSAGAQDAPAGGSFLAGYRHVLGPVIPAGVEDNLSGLAFDTDRGRLLAILNKPTRIVELDREGSVLGTVELSGYEDTEDVAYLGGGRVAVLEERRRLLTVADLPQGTNVIAYAGGGVRVEPENFENVGLEGVAYDAAADRLFVVKEKTPRRVYAVDRKAPAGDASAVTRPWDLESNNFGLADISAVAFVPATGNLLILSDESRCIVECTADGRELGRLPLTAGSAGLVADITQPEGLALDEAGRLYIVAEPNKFYVFAKP